MILVRAGSFRMGNDLPTNPSTLGQSPVFENGDADEKPVHEVRITYDFYVSETEITAAQFCEFHEHHEDTGMFSPYAAGVSWEDAAEYCRWLSAKEGKSYRLPTDYVTVEGSPGLAGRERVRTLARVWLARLEELERRLDEDNLPYLARESGEYVPDPEYLRKNRPKLLEAIRSARKYYMEQAR